MSIGFIGCGNMATAIINGIVKTNTIKAEEIYAYDVFTPATEKLKEQININICSSNNDVVKNSDIVVLAVKPNVLGDVLQNINISLDEKKPLLISIAAGKTIDFIRSNLSHDNKIIRVMPNINAVVGEAICGYTANELVSEDDKLQCEKIFGGVGQVIYLEEKMFPLFGVIGGCSPAFTYMYIDAMARTAVQNGMKKDAALMIAAQAVLGSAKMILESNEHPWELIDKVCSPGGTTIDGVLSLQKDGFECSITNAINKAIEKDSKL